ncbi:MAG: hypothetical protein SNH73_01410 [Rikenellaceae bacterium]
MPLNRSILLFLLLLFFGCNTEGQFSKVVDVDITGWSTPTEVRFTVEAAPQRAELQLLFRCSELLSPDTIELFITTKAPDGVLWSEPFTICKVAAGASINIAEVPYRRNIEWSQQGEYSITLQPLRLYEGITSVGINMIYN